MTIFVAASLMVSVMAIPAVADGDPTIYDITKDRNFVDRNADDFDVLNIAIKVAGLKPVLDDPGAGPLTVFAPTDQAFKDVAGALCGRWAARSELGAVICLYFKLGRDGIASVVLGHAVEGEIDSAAAIASVGGTLTTLAGSSLDVVAAGGVGIGLIDDSGGTSNIIAVDIDASNGIVHVIDRVLLAD